MGSAFTIRLPSVRTRSTEGCLHLLSWLPAACTVQSDAVRPVGCYSLHALVLLFASLLHTL